MAEISKNEMSIMLDLGYCMSLCCFAKLMDESHIDELLEGGKERYRKQGFKDIEINRVLNEAKNAIDIFRKGE